MEEPKGSERGTEKTRKNAADKIYSMVRDQSQARLKKALEDNQRETKYTHIMSNEKQVTSYVIMKDVKGKDVYKKRTVIKERRLKERSDSYYERKEKAIQDRIARLNDEYK